MFTVRLSFAALWVFIVSPLTALGGITEGIGWLATQPNANGSFGGTPTSLATEVRSTAEVIRAYQELGQQSQPAYLPALSFLNNDTAADQTRFLARKITVNAKAGNDVTALVNTLTANQSTDGGFGNRAGDASSILDTALVLEALAAANYTSSSVAVGSIGYLLNKQLASGGWVDGANDPSVYLTALSFRALWFYRNTNTNVPAALARARDFLLSQRDASGTWGEPFNTALVLTALVPYLPDLSSVTNSISSLQSAQLANGSWVNDPYTTALALQALYLAALPQPNPDYATIQGKVVDAQTGLPLSGVAVSLSGAATAALVTPSDGTFSFRNLGPGSYSLQLALVNYATLSVSTVAGVGRGVSR
jgi:squalene cyclase